jgi:multidrug efflux system membrane fusion protein
VTTVQQKDVPLYLEGLGTVQPINTVTIRVRVEGQLTKILFEEGQEVREGDVLAKIDAAPIEAQLAQAEAQKAQNMAQLENARLDLARNTDLLARRVISQQQFDTQKAQVAQFEAAVKADEAAILSQRVQLGYTTITAPIDGRIGLRLIDRGNIIRTGDANGLIVITQMHPTSVVFTLPEQNLWEVQQQMKLGPLTIYALDRDNKPTMGEGRLTVIDNQIDQTTGTIKLRATFENEDERLWPGQFVNARLLLKTLKDGIVVPAQVIQRGPQGTYAFVLKPDEASATGGDETGTVEVRPVKVAQIQEGEALIEDGLKLGERVVMEGQYRLQSNSKVRLAPARPSAGKGSQSGNTK